MKKLRNAGIAAIASLIFSIISFARIIIKIAPHANNQEASIQAIAELSTPSYIIISLVMGVLIAIFLFQGFINLGKRFNNKLLITVGWALMILLIANELISNLPSLISPDFAPNALNGIIFVILFSVFLFLLGISLTQIKQKVKLAKSLGILYIITSITFIIGMLVPNGPLFIGFLIAIGLLALFIGLVVATLMFLKASKQFEK